MRHYIDSEIGRDHIDSVVDRSKEQCLLRDGSLLLDAALIWSLRNLEGPGVCAPGGWNAPQSLKGPQAV